MSSSCHPVAYAGAVVVGAINKSMVWNPVDKAKSSRQGIPSTSKIPNLPCAIKTINLCSSASSAYVQVDVVLHRWVKRRRRWVEAAALNANTNRGAVDIVHPVAGVVGVHRVSCPNTINVGNMHSSGGKK